MSDTASSRNAPAWIAQHVARQNAAQIPTDQPQAIAAYLRELLARYARTLTTPNGTPFSVVPANAIRCELNYLMHAIQPDSDDEPEDRPDIRCYIDCGQLSCDSPY